MGIIIGSVSHGTMRDEDLVPCFLDVVEELGSKDKCIKAIRKRMRREGYWESDDVGYDLEELYDLLNELAPDGYYFGAHPGDGSDYGFWENEPE